MQNNIKQETKPATQELASDVLEIETTSEVKAAIAKRIGDNLKFKVGTHEGSAPHFEKVNVSPGTLV